ncbi:hypothetical protein [Streptomyces sp. SID5910]|uniref:vWA-MoxR associated conflict system protein n=1 Tax=Streptomyces sp. SID5910 TaxID=2690312 RepID=UPI00136C9F90|nr:hypothetical protein [Streptomyces sp. SID5910]
MSSATNPPRNVLVVGAQCRDGSRLEGLEEAAQALHAALVNPRLGACADRGGDSLLVGTGLGRDRVVAAVERAAQAAQRDGGPLVLALLGHGESGEGTPLHLVTSGRENDPELSNVAVPALLGGVLNHPGVSGLIAIVDTCFAGGAVPDSSRITAGRQDGSVQFALLFAATAKEQAFDMRLSTELVRLMEEGRPGPEEVLKLDDNLLDRLSERIQGQQPGLSSFRGTASLGAPLWLARNRAAGSGGPLGPIAGKAVRETVQRIDPGLRLSTEEEIAAWLKVDSPSVNGASWYAVQRLRELLGELTAGRKTLNVISTAFGTALTEDNLRLAGMLAGFPLDFVRHEAPRLRDLVEHAVHHGSAAEGSQRALAHLVAALAHITGHSDRLPEEVIAWAEDLELAPAVNSRLSDLNEQRDEVQAPRLVLVLADEGTEDVVAVDAWLLFGRAVLTNQRFPCGRQRNSLTAAMTEAISWAAPWANIVGRPLQHIDVAAPTLVLLDCPPEEQLVHKAKLGVNYVVTTRWSGLLTPPAGMTVDDMLQVGERLLASLEGGACLGPTWLHEEHLTALEELQDHLSNHGRGQKVWSLTSTPETDWEFIAQELLEHTPALVWPRHKDISDARLLKDSVARHWQALPEQIAHAYRTQLSGTSPGEDGLEPLATVRAAWHDTHWQVFCQRRARAVVRAPHETTPKERL